MEKIPQQSSNESYDFIASLKSWLREFYPPEKMPEIKELHDMYMRAIDENDTDKLTQLLGRLENRIDYLEPKSRDTDEQKTYIAGLKTLREDLLDYITRPEEN